MSSSTGETEATVFPHMSCALPPRCCGTHTPPFPTKEIVKTETKKTKRKSPTLDRGSRGCSSGDAQANACTADGQLDLVDRRSAHGASCPFHLHKCMGTRIVTSMVARGGSQYSTGQDRCPIRLTVGRSVGRPAGRFGMMDTVWSAGAFILVTAGAQRGAIRCTIRTIELHRTVLAASVPEFGCTAGRPPGPVSTT